MPTLVGKKFQGKSTSATIEVLQDLGNSELLCKFTHSVHGRQHCVIVADDIVKYWKEVREPRVIYINDYDGTHGFKGLSQSHYTSEDAAKGWKAGGYIATRKFIEVIE